MDYRKYYAEKNTAKVNAERAATMDTENFLEGGDGTILHLTPQEAYSKRLCTKQYVEYRAAIDRVTNKHIIK